MKRRRVKKHAAAMIPILKEIANDARQPAEIRLWSVGALSRIVDGKTVSSAALNSLINRVREFQKVAPPPSPTPAPKYSGDDLGVPSSKPPATADIGRQEALAIIRSTKKG